MAKAKIYLLTDDDQLVDVFRASLPEGQLPTDYELLVGDAAHDALHHQQLAFPIVHLICIDLRTHSYDDLPEQFNYLQFMTKVALYTDDYAEIDNLFDDCWYISHNVAIVRKKLNHALTFWFEWLAEYLGHHSNNLKTYLTPIIGYTETVLYPEMLGQYAANPEEFRITSPQQRFLLSVVVNNGRKQAQYLTSMGSNARILANRYSNLDDLENVPLDFIIEEIISNSFWQFNSVEYLDADLESEFTIIVPREKFSLHVNNWLPSAITLIIDILRDMTKRIQVEVTKIEHHVQISIYGDRRWDGNNFPPMWEQGWFIANYIIEAHGSTIEIEYDDDPENGATFIFTLPIATDK